MQKGRRRAVPSHVTALTHISSLPAPSPSVAVSEGPTSEWNEVLSPPRPCSVAEAEGGESDGRKNAPRAIQEKADIMSWNLRLCYLNRVNGNLMSYILTRVRTRISPGRYDESYGDFAFPLSHFQFQALFICVIHRHIFT